MKELIEKYQREVDLLIYELNERPSALLNTYNRCVMNERRFTLEQVIDDLKKLQAAENLTTANHRQENSNHL